MPLIATKGNAGAFAYGFTAGAGEVIGGMVLVTPTSVTKTGTGSTATISANGSVTFSSCSSVSLNGIFTTDYDAYMIMARDAGSADSWHMRLRASGTDETTGYTRAQITVDGISQTAGQSSLGYWQAAIIGYTAVAQNGASIMMYGPFLAEPTSARSWSALASGSAYLVDRSYIHDASTSYDGLTFTTTTTGVIAGTVSVYGLVGT